MNSLKTNKLLFALLLVGLFNPLSLYSPNFAQGSGNLSLTQLDPNIVISSLVLNNNLPEEGDEIIASITVDNEDNIEYSNLLVKFSLIPESSSRDDNPGDDLAVGNKIIPIFKGLETLTFEISFTAPAGQYKASAIILFNNLPIQGSQTSVSIQILTNQVGDNKTPIVAILILVLFFILILFGQAIYDTIKLKNVNLHSNGKK